MPKGYWITRVDVYDHDRFKEYARLNPIALKKYQARFIVRSAQFELKDGSARGRNAVVEFPTYQMALDCFNSEEYQRALATRKTISSADVIIVEGYDGPQP